MANLTSPKFSNIARPYALAAFEYADEKKQLTEWKQFLETTSSIANDPAVTKLLLDPTFSSEKLLKLFEGVLGNQLNEERTNFLRLIAHNDRLLFLPEINELFKEHYAALEKTSTVRVITAVKAEESFMKKLIQSLTERIKREVTVQWEVDSSILGGAIIYIGDKVIDGSIRGKLARLLEFSLR